jgi:uncharacterized protein
MMPTSTTASSGIALTPEQAKAVRSILRSVLANGSPTDSNHSSLQAWVFGSRATGHARPFSDLDIVISQPQPLDWRARADLADAFEASSLPFRVDVVEEARLSPGIAQRVLAERLPLL